MAARTEPGPSARGEPARAERAARVERTAPRDQLDRMRRELRRAARVPFPPNVRLTRLLRALFDHLTAHPDTLRLLSGDTCTARAARAAVAAEVAGLFAGSAPPAEVTAASAGVVGFALANVLLCVTGALEVDQAFRVTRAFCTSQLPGPRGRRDSKLAGVHKIY